MIAAATLLLGATQQGVEAQQTRVITGRVLASTGEPLAGVEVGITQGSSIRAGSSTLSGVDGSFAVRVPDAPVSLTLRRLGYKRHSVNVPANQATLAAVLELDVLRLDEMVVTGQATGIQRRNLANAVATVSAEQLSVAPASSLETLLAGKIAGADIQSNSGAPGGGNQINLRGVTSIIGSATPLYVVDGIIVSDATVPSGANSVSRAGGGAIASNQDNSPNRIADLNPADIASIEVLKGASAAAIYGSKANNGVILISTKRGQAGRPQYNFSQRMGVSYLSNKIGTRVFRDSATAVGAFGAAAAPYFAGGQVPRTYDLEEQLAGGAAPSWESSLSISGGSDNTRYFVSGLAHQEEGVVSGTFYDKYSVKLNLDQRVSDRFSFDVSSSAVHSKTDRGFTNNDNTSTTYYVAWSGTPNFVDLRRNEDGNFPRNPFRNSNPLETAALATNEEGVYRFLGSVRATFDAFSNGTHTLRFSSNTGADIFTVKDLVHTSEDLQFERLDGVPGTAVNSSTLSRQLNLGLNAVHTFTPSQFSVSATTSFGIQYEFRDLDIMRARTRNLFPGQQNAGQGTDHLAQQTRSRTKDLGFFAQEELLVGDRLLLTAGIRSDRSSNNTDIERWYHYPKAAASYRLSPLPGLVDELKLRAAWGRAGNQPLYGQKFNILNPGSVGGLQTLALSGTTVAQDLRPERQTEIEGGLDASFLNNRMSAEFTAYRRIIDDLLLNRALAPSTGFGTALYNSQGRMRTSGIEAALMLVPIQKRHATWTASLIFSRDRSVMDSLDVPPFNAPSAGFGTSLGTVRLQQGKSTTQIVGRDTISVVDDPRCLEFLQVQPGSGRCLPGTRIETALGDANPDFRMGFTNQLRYRRLTFLSTVDGQYGSEGVNLTGYLLDINRNTKDFDDPCKGSNCRPGETMGQYRLRVYPARTSRNWIEDMSFLKLRELSLAFDVAPEMLQSTRVLSPFKTMRVGLSGRNLYTWDRYSGFDPEVNNFGSQAIRANVEVTPYPPSRSFWLTLNVSF